MAWWTLEVLLQVSFTCIEEGRSHKLILYISNDQRAWYGTSAASIVWCLKVSINPYIYMQLKPSFFFFSGINLYWEIISKSTFFLLLSLFFLICYCAEIIRALSSEIDLQWRHTIIALLIFELCCHELQTDSWCGINCQSASISCTMYNGNRDWFANPNFQCCLNNFCHACLSSSWGLYNFNRKSWFVCSTGCFTKV